MTRSPWRRTKFEDLKPKWIGWVAGIIEGEGTFYVVKRNGAMYPKIKVNMTDEDSIRRLTEVTGMGRMYGPINPPSQKARGCKPQWEWHLSQRDHQMTLVGAIWPFLNERRKQQAGRMFFAWREQRLAS